MSPAPAVSQSERVRQGLDAHTFRIRQIIWLATVQTYDFGIPDTLESFFEDIHQDCDRSIPPLFLSVQRPVGSAQEEPDSQDSPDEPDAQGSPADVIALLQEHGYDGFLFQLEQPRLLPDGISFNWDSTDRCWVYGSTITEALRAATERAKERFPAITETA